MDILVSLVTIAAIIVYYLHEIGKLEAIYVIEFFSFLFLGVSSGYIYHYGFGPYLKEILLPMAILFVVLAIIDRVSSFIFKDEEDEADREESMDGEKDSSGNESNESEG